MRLHQTKKFLTAKETMNKMKRQPTEWENIFTTTGDKELIFKMYKELIKLSTKKPPFNLIKKMGKGPE